MDKNTFIMKFIPYINSDKIHKGGVFMYYGGYGYGAGAGAGYGTGGYGTGAGGYGCCEPANYGCCNRGGYGYALILVLFILLVIIGCSCYNPCPR